MTVDRSRFVSKSGPTLPKGFFLILYNQNFSAQTIDAQTIDNLKQVLEMQKVQQSVVRGAPHLRKYRR